MISGLYDVIANNNNNINNIGSSRGIHISTCIYEFQDADVSMGETGSECMEETREEKSLLIVQFKRIN